MSLELSLNKMENVNWSYLWAKYDICCYGPFFKGFKSDQTILLIVGSARVTDDNWTDAKAKLQHDCRPAPCS